jgi:hypothetical protein
MVRNGNSGLDFLRARQQDDGSIWYSKNSDQTRVWVTSDALVGLSGEFLPVDEPDREPDPTPQPESGGSNGGSNGGSGGSGTGFVPDLSESGSSSGGGNGSGSGGSDASNGPGGPIEPVPDPVPDPGGTEADVSAPSAFSSPVVPSAELVSASEAGPEPSPLVAVLICLGVTGALAGGTVLLARKFGW